ncbi:MAG: PepSY domain-containing protein [Prevotella sp.]|jgi:uncharacterized iron-regulated membrane protein|nr:PepSY domain-containing protein [Prevotella sp.]
MKVKRIAYNLHLWIGMISGIIVFIVCMTGAIWALNIHGWIGSDSIAETEIPNTGSPLLKPSQLAELSADTLGVDLTYVTYAQNAPVRIGTYNRKNRISALMDPYTGKILAIDKFNTDGFNFWHFIRQGHRFLWLSPEIGRPIVNYGTLAFVLVLISGLVYWFPKSKKDLKRKLWFKWKKKTNLRRRFFDLHTVLGLYSCFVLIAISLTGMVWGLEWWSKGLYKVTSGGKELPQWGTVYSDTLSVNIADSLSPKMATDIIFEKIIKENPHAYSVHFGFPDAKDKSSVISVYIYPQKNVYYNSDSYYFDRYSLKEIKTDGPYSGKYSDAVFADKLRRMNYDIHIGSVWGTPGRLLMFFAALFGASLPITGFYLFFKKRIEKRKKHLTK